MGTRISDAAIERDRISSHARYHQNKGQRQKVQKAYRDRSFDEREFIGFDGEGYNAYAVDSAGVIEIEHRYMLFGASTGDSIQGINLTTTECLEFIHYIKRENPGAYLVGFSFEYDINMIVRNLPWRGLAILHECGKCRWADHRTNKRYRIEHVPHKWLRVSSDGVSATIYDSFGFFHTGYVKALKNYHIGDPAKLERIEAGKGGRGRFTYADIEEVKAYMFDELSLLPPLMDSIRDAAYGGGYRISEWHGPGALAAYLLRDQGVSKWHSKGTSAEVKSAIRHAYAGGRFTGALCGLYIGPIYTADINSAYIYACSLMPRMDRGRWARQNPDAIDSGNLARFGLYHIEFEQSKPPGFDSRGIPEPPYPLFHRSKNGTLRWPRKCKGWYWTPEAELVVGHPGAHILEAWIFNGDSSKPFRFVHDAFNRRLELQHQGNPAEKAYKWALAAMYGAFARRVGWNKQARKAPPSHELAWAGFITSWCRANVYKPAVKAWMKGDGRGLISIDTDGVTATVPFSREDLPNGVGENLGQWKLEEWTGILQWQNGIYWLRDSDGNWKDPKSRGIPKGAIPFDAAKKALDEMDFGVRPYVHPRLGIVRTRFIGYPQALRGQFKKWRKWVTEPVEIMMGGNPHGKAFHFYARCHSCLAARMKKDYGTEDVRNLHTITNTAIDQTMSAPHRLPWLEDQPDLLPGQMVSDFRYIVRDEDM